MTFCGNPLSQSLSEVKRTSLFAAHMSAYDPNTLIDETGQAIAAVTPALATTHAQLIELADQIAERDGTVAGHRAFAPLAYPALTGGLVDWGIMSKVPDFIGERGWDRTIDHLIKSQLLKAG